ncbi:MAG: hypothetical protein A4E53_03663 [Pelotomaculum sp. PtaB.Bin104]|nr:MAG: hypothetical protein A4E53_03663 [Pelotomaculum sp. PtaB.Bin104]
MAKNQSRPGGEDQMAGKAKENPSIITSKSMCAKKTKAESLKNKAAE